MNKEAILTALEGKFPQYQGILQYLKFENPANHVFTAGEDEIVVSNEDCDDVFKIFINDEEVGTL